MKPPIAVLDLGTNTFHLLIAHMDARGVQEVFRERRFVRLAEKGIDRIHPEPFERGMAALGYFRERLEEYGVTRLKAFGTAALRTASNGPEFLEEAWKRFGIQVELISGKEEARLIQLGVAQAVPLNEHKDLIMDIGGGSVEFIIADQYRVYWSSSFPVGVAVLFRRFHLNDPIRQQELEGLKAFLQEALQPLTHALIQHPSQRLIGASGTFDVLENLAVREKKHPLHAELPISFFPEIYDRLVYTTLEQRLSMEGIPPERAEMIVVAMELLRWVVKTAAVREIVISAYAMKEGIMKEMVTPA